MRVVLPIFHGRVSPVLDSARVLLLVDYSRESTVYRAHRGEKTTLGAVNRRPQHEAGEICGLEVARSEVSLEATNPLRRVARLRGLWVDVVICGVVSRPLSAALSAAGITVIPLRRGPVEEVLAAFVAGSLGNARFRLPGSDRKPPDHHPIQPVRNAGQSPSGNSGGERACSKPPPGRAEAFPIPNS